MDKSNAGYQSQKQSNGKNKKNKNQNPNGDPNHSYMTDNGQGDK